MTFDKVAYNSKYNKEKYAEIKLRVPKDYKEEITNFYTACNYTSMNSYITTLIQNDMDIATKKMNSLDADEKFLLNCFRYADEEYRQELLELAAKADNAHTPEEKQKLFNLRRIQSQRTANKEWQEDFDKPKLPPYHAD